MDHIRSIYARLVVEGADAALEFYVTAFGATVEDRFAGPDGRLHHAMVVAGPVRFAVKDAGAGDPAPSSDGMPVIMALEVDDVDAVAQRLLANGATTIHPVDDHDYGERAGRFRDPWGHQWMIWRALATTP